MNVKTEEREWFLSDDMGEMKLVRQNKANFICQRCWCIACL